MWLRRQGVDAPGSLAVPEWVVQRTRPLGPVGRYEPVTVTLPCMIEEWGTQW